MMVLAQYKFIIWNRPIVLNIVLLSYPKNNLIIIKIVSISTFPLINMERLAVNSIGT